MNFYKINVIRIFFIFLIAFSSPLFTESHDTEENIVDKSKKIAEEIKKKQASTQANISSEIGEEEPLPLNDPFVGDSSFSGTANILSNSQDQDDQKLRNLYNYKLVGIITGSYESFITLINQDGEFVTLELHEELSDGVKLVDLRLGEAIFEKDDTSYLIINFKNEIREANEY